MICTQCGTTLTVDEKFCHHCGAAVPRPHVAETGGGRPAASAAALIGLSLALALTVACVGGALLLGVVLPEETGAEADLPFAFWYGTDGLDGAEGPASPAEQEPAQEGPLDAAAEPTLTPTAEPAATPTPSSPQIAVHVGDARTFSASPETIIYANVDHAPLPEGAGVLWVCPTQGFRFREWVGIPPGCTYELTLSSPTTSLGVQFWGDGDDGVARVSVDGQVRWEGNTRGENANWPGGAFVRYVAVDYLPAESHVVRIEAVGDGPVTIYFMGAGYVTP